MNSYKKEKFSSLFISADFFVALVYIFTAIVLEVVQFLWLGWGVPQYWLLDIALLMIISGIVFIIPKMIAKQIVYIILLLIPTILNIVNITLYQVFGSVLNINMLKLGRETMTVFSFDFLNIWNILVNLIIFGLAVYAIIIIPKKMSKKVQKPVKSVSKYAFILAFFVVFEYLGFFGFGYITTNLATATSILGNDAYLYDSLYIANESYKKFGTYGYYFKAIQTVSTKSKINNDEELKTDLQKLKSGEGYKFSTSVSGTLEGYNVVSILLESFDTFAISPMFTPTMWDLQTSSGTNFSNFYGRNKTNISEAVSLIGNAPSEILPKQYYDTVGLSLQNSLPNLIKKDAIKNNQTVKTGFYHSYLADFYGRNETHIEYGFDEVLGLKEIYGRVPTKNFDDRILEAECFDMVMDKILPTDVNRFYSHITTFSSHGSYDTKVEVFEEYEAYAEEHYAEYCEWLEQNGFVVPTDDVHERQLKTYVARCMDTDNFVKNLLNAIEEKGMADNTLVILYADHAPYYNDIGVALKGIQKNEYYNSERNHIPFMMWANGLQKGTIDTFCSHYDIYPTVCDLMNLPLNTEVTQGKSIFADDRAELFVCFLSGMYNAKYYSDNIEDVYNIDGTVATENAETEKFRQDAVDFYVKQEFIEKVWANNLFSKI